MPKSIVYDANRAALSKSANLFAGDSIEFVPYSAMVKLSVVASAIGMRISVFADTDLLVDDKEIPFIGTTLIDKDHVVDTFEVEPGTRLSIFLRETANVATTDTYVALEVTPLD